MRLIYVVLLIVVFTTEVVAESGKLTSGEESALQKQLIQLVSAFNMGNMKYLVDSMPETVFKASNSDKHKTLLEGEQLAAAINALGFVTTIKHQKILDMNTCNGTKVVFVEINMVQENPVVKTKYRSIDYWVASRENGSDSWNFASGINSRIYFDKIYGCNGVKLDLPQGLIW